MKKCLDLESSLDKKSNSAILFAGAIRLLNFSKFTHKIKITLQGYCGSHVKQSELTRVLTICSSGLQFLSSLPDLRLGMLWWSKRPFLKLIHNWVFVSPLVISAQTYQALWSKSLSPALDEVLPPNLRYQGKQRALHHCYSPQSLMGSYCSWARIKAECRGHSTAELRNCRFFLVSSIIQRLFEKIVFHLKSTWDIGKLLRLNCFLPDRPLFEILHLCT